MRSSTLSRWAPRSVPARECTSSTITKRRSANRRAAGTRGEISITSSDSGVVRSSSEGSATSLRLCASGVSPCHTKLENPAISAYRLRRSAWLLSSAFSGATYKAATAVGGRSMSAESIGKTAASVLPPAVGAMIKVFFPSRIASPAISCTGRSAVQPRRAAMASRSLGDRRAKVPMGQNSTTAGR